LGWTSIQEPRWNKQKCSKCHVRNTKVKKSLVLGNFFMSKCLCSWNPILDI
jgi:hypothetical protein